MNFSQQYVAVVCLMDHSDLHPICVIEIQFFSTSFRVIVQRFISLAWRLHQLSNYNTMFAVLCGLELIHVSRLKSTWKPILSGGKFGTRYEFLLQVSLTVTLTAHLHSSDIVHKFIIFL